MYDIKVALRFTDNISVPPFIFLSDKISRSIKIRSPVPRAAGLPHDTWNVVAIGGSRGVPVNAMKHLARQEHVLRRRERRELRNRRGGCPRLVVDAVPFIVISSQLVRSPLITNDARLSIEHRPRSFPRMTIMSGVTPGVR